MFNGIVEGIGKIINIEIQAGCKCFTIEPLIMLTNLSIGESVCINGVCLTITEFSSTNFKVTAVPETLKLTNLSQLTINHVVNIERALRLQDRVSGHYLQGHVEGIGKILEMHHDDNSQALLVKIEIPPRLSKYIINKGYIGLDGMSITVIQAAQTFFTVTFIPHTQNVTIIPTYRIGTFVNIETDIMGKYIEKMLEVYQHAV